MYKKNPYLKYSFFTFKYIGTALKFTTGWWKLVFGWEHLPILEDNFRFKRRDFFYFDLRFFHNLCTKNTILKWKKILFRFSYGKKKSLSQNILRAVLWNQDMWIKLSCGCFHYIFHFGSDFEIQEFQSKYEICLEHWSRWLWNWQEFQSKRSVLILRKCYV